LAGFKLRNFLPQQSATRSPARVKLKAMDQLFIRRRGNFLTAAVILLNGRCVPRKNAISLPWHRKKTNAAD
jgi:hypothetical protein